jgi:hypothetical protein
MKTASILGTLVTLLATAEAVTQAQAEKRFKAAGIKWSSSGGCTDKTKTTCTSFDGLRESTVAGAITLKKACNCDLTITGGTERGHEDGPQSHAKGMEPYR